MGRKPHLNPHPVYRLRRRYPKSPTGNSQQFYLGRSVKNPYGFFTWEFLHCKNSHAIPYGMLYKHRPAAARKMLLQCGAWLVQRACTALCRDTVPALYRGTVLALYRDTVQGWYRGLVIGRCSVSAQAKK